MRRIPLLCVIWLLIVTAGESLAQAPQPAFIIFRDGFVIKGRVKEQRDAITDPVSGVSLSIPLAGGFIYVDDDVRKIFFSPGQLQQVLPRDPNEDKDLVKLSKVGTSVIGAALMPGTEFERVGDWNKKWERTISASTPRGRAEIGQRITKFTPEYIRVDSLGYNWIPHYKTREFSPDVLISLLESYYGSGQKEVKDMKEPDKRFQIARFLVQAGLHDHANKELAKISESYPDLQSSVEPLQESLKKTRAGFALEVIERAFKTGQYQQTQRHLAQYDLEKLEKYADQRIALKIEEVRNKHEAGIAKQKQVTQLFESLPKEVASHAKEFFQDALATITKEISIDGLGRLDTFIEYAAQYERELKEKKLTTQKTEEVLALAVSGWTQGNASASPNVADAQQLWKTRTFLLDYQRQELPMERQKMLAAFQKEHELKPDLVARLIAFLPPAQPAEITDATKPITLTTANGNAMVQVPPEYNPVRSYPVLFVFHESTEKPAGMLDRWKGLAGMHGYIVVAPDWGRGLRPSYLYSEREHGLVLDTLRELRRKFHIDSDRVFLFGREEGGAMAYDIGLSHPDQFAGVMCMSASPAYFPQRYWTNAQFLPFYITEGDLNSVHCKQTQQLMKDWIRNQYPAIYCQYKGRPGDHFSGEFPIMIDWMNRKKRHHPTKQLGRYHTAGGVGEEFKSMRDHDNSFYWLTHNGIASKNVNNPPPSWNLSTVAATLQATISTGNDLELKIGKIKDEKIEAVKGVRIWNQIDVRLTGVPRATLWISPDMIDFAKPLQVVVNGRRSGVPHPIRPSLETLLEHYHEHGDRQRLFYAKVQLEP